MIKERKNAGRCWGGKRKAAQQNKKKTNSGNKSEGTGEERKTKKILSEDHTILTKKTFQNNERKFYQQAERECTKTYLQPNDKETK